MKFRNIAKICRPHGLKGALKLELLSDDSLNLLESDCIKLIDGESITIARIFGVVKNFCIIEINGYNNIDLIQHFRGHCIARDCPDEFCYEDLIGLKILERNRVVAEITDIHNFGAGILCDTTFDMISVDELNLNSIKNGTVELL